MTKTNLGDFILDTGGSNPYDQCLRYANTGEIVPNVNSVEIKTMSGSPYISVKFHYLIMPGLNTVNINVSKSNANEEKVDKSRLKWWKLGKKLVYFYYNL